MAKQTARVKSAEEIAQEGEFYRRRSMVRVEVRQISSERSIDVYLRHHQLGDIGSMHRSFKRGRETGTIFILPTVEGLS